MKVLKIIAIILCIMLATIGACLATEDPSALSVTFIFLLFTWLLFRSLKKAQKKKAQSQNLETRAMSLKKANSVSNGEKINAAFPTDDLDTRKPISREAPSKCEFYARSYFGVIYIKTADGVICREDGNALTPFDIEWLRSSNMQEAKEQVDRAINPKFNRTNKERELSSNFTQRWGHIVHPMEKDFQDMCHVAYSESSPEKQIEKCLETLALFNKARDFCYKKGEGGQIYFQNMWEYMHNSNTPCFSFEDTIKDRIDYLSSLHYENIPAILEAIRNGGGKLLQKDIYSLVPNIPRGEVQSIIRQLDKDGRVKREKKGSTYKLSAF